MFELDFVFIGPKKTATTWIYEHLKGHPEICFPKDVKETFFFNKNYEKGLDWYKWHFNHSDDQQLIGEVAPSYFDVEEVPQRVKEINKECKIFITLRNPVERARSFYHHKILYGKLDRDSSFTNAISEIPTIVTSGYYAEHISRWVNTFGRRNIHFCVLEDIKSNPREVLNSIFNILNVVAVLKEEDLKKKINKASLPVNKFLAKYAVKAANYLRSKRLHKVVELGKFLGLKSSIYKEGDADLPELTTEEKKMLYEEYEDHINYVEDLLNRSFEDWKVVN